MPLTPPRFAPLPSCRLPVAKRTLIRTLVPVALCVAVSAVLPRLCAMSVLCQQFGCGQDRDLSSQDRVVRAKARPHSTHNFTPPCAPFIILVGGALCLFGRFIRFSARWGGWFRGDASNCWSTLFCSLTRFANCFFCFFMSTRSEQHFLSKWQNSETFKFSILPKQSRLGKIRPDATIVSYKQKFTNNLMRRPWGLVVYQLPDNSSLLTI